jgi:hypothetical protein
MKIQNGYLSKGYDKLKEISNTFVAALPEIEAYGMVEVQATEEDQQNWLDRAIVSSYNQMKGQFDTQTKSKVVKKITSLSFNKFVENTEIKYIKEMDASNYEPFAANLISGLDTDPQTKA